MTQALRVPTGCGEIAAWPALSGMAAFVREAHGALAARPRRAAREEVLALAARQTADMDGAVVAVPDAAAPLFVTGHQPDLYHPGIWVKNFILDLVCRDTDIVGLNLTVDADLASRAVDLPRRVGDAWQRAAVALPGIRAGLPWEVQPPLDEAGWVRLGEAVLGVLPPSAREPFEAFLGTVRRSPSVLGARTLADSLARARRAWESKAGRRRYLELDVSTMCGTAAFHDFVAGVLARLEDFWETHNDCLRDYRTRHHIRTAANPVPDLRRRGDLWETPFWCVHPGGERGGLFLERDGDGWKVESKDTTYGRLHIGDESGWSEQLAAMLAAGRSGLRPRALTLTMFARRAIADVFLHGIGGARYERVGEAIAARFFGDAAAAPWATASATMCLDLGSGAVADDPAALRRRLRDLVYNPQRFVEGGDARKQALIDAIRTAPRGDKKRLGADIESINASLRRSLADTEADLARRLRAAEAEQTRRAVTAWRGYPYFLFAPEGLEALVQQ